MKNQSLILLRHSSSAQQEEEEEEKTVLINISPSFLKSYWEVA